MTRANSFVHSDVRSLSEGTTPSASSRRASNLHSKMSSSQNQGRSSNQVSTSRRNQGPAPPTPFVTAKKEEDEVSCFRRLVSVRVITAVMCLLLIIATAAIVLAVTSTFSLEAAQEISSKYALSISNKAKGDVEDFLNLPARYIRGWQYLMMNEEHALPADEKDPNWLAHWSQRLIDPQASNKFSLQGVYMGFSSGHFIYVSAPTSTTFRASYTDFGTRNISDPASRSLSTRKEYHRSNYSQVRVTYVNSSYDPRTRPWYADTDKTPGTSSFSNIYIESDATFLVITAVSPMYNATGYYLGTAGIDIDLTRISSFLRTLDRTPNTMAFLIDNDNLIVETTYDKPLLITTTYTNYTGTVASNCIRNSAGSVGGVVIVCRQYANEYAYAPLQELVRSEPSYFASGAEGVREITLDGKRHFVTVVAIQTPGINGINWRTAIFLPEDDIIGGIVKGRNIAIYICIGVVTAAVIFALIVITLLLRPLDAVADRMYRVAMMQDVDEEDDEGNITTTAPKNSSLYEVATIQTAFNTMTAELAKIKSFLPQSVLAQLYGTDEDDIEGDVAEVATVISDGRRSVNGSMNDSIMRKALSSYGGSSMGSSVVHGARLNTSVKLSTKKVTMLCLNILGFHRHAIQRTSDELVRQHAKIVKAISDICSENRGVMDGFQGDRFTISFNAVTHAGSHPVLAARAARVIGEMMTSKFHLKMTSGVASGVAMVGNMGSATTKRFTVISSVVSSAVLLERLSKRFFPQQETHVTLAAGSALQEIELTFDTLTMDAIQLPSAGGGIKRTRVCAVMAPREAAADEWMYEVHEGHKNSRFGAVNEAFRLFLEGMVCEAGEITTAQLEATTSSSPDDEASHQVRNALLYINGLIVKANSRPGGLSANDYGSLSSLNKLFGALETLWAKGTSIVTSASKPVHFVVFWEC